MKQEAALACRVPAAKPPAQEHHSSRSQPVTADAISAQPPAEVDAAEAEKPPGGEHVIVNAGTVVAALQRVAQSGQGCVDLLAECVPVLDSAWARAPGAAGAALLAAGIVPAIGAVLAAAFGQSSAWAHGDDAVVALLASVTVAATLPAFNRAMLRHSVDSVLMLCPSFISAVHAAASTAYEQLLATDQEMGRAGAEQVRAGRC